VLALSPEGIAEQEKRVRELGRGRREHIGFFEDDAKAK